METPKYREARNADPVRRARYLAKRKREYLKNKQKHIEYQREARRTGKLKMNTYRKLHPEKAREYGVRAKYGLSAEAWTALQARASGLCEACRTPWRSVVCAMIRRGCAPWQSI